MRKRRREEKLLFSFMLVLILILLTVIAAGIVFYVVSQERNSCLGTWYAELSYEDEIKQRTAWWIHEESDGDEAAPIEGGDVLTPVALQLTLEKDGTWHLELVEDSYAQCRNNAYDYAVLALTETIAKQLSASGYDGPDGNQAAKDLIAETVGGDPRAYLEEVMPSLLPDREKISQAYAGSGTYQYDKKSGILEFTDSLGNTWGEKMILHKDQMVFTMHVGETVKQYEERKYPLVWEKE